MIERNVAMAILGALPDDKLLKALQVAGVAPVAADQGMDALAVGQGMDPTAAGPGNKIQPWNERQVSYGGGKDRPALIDRMWASQPTDMNAQQPVQGGAVTGSDIYLQTGGM